MRSLFVLIISFAVVSVSICSVDNDGVRTKRQEVPPPVDTTPPPTTVEETPVTTTPEAKTENSEVKGPETTVPEPVSKPEILPEKNSALVFAQSIQGTWIGSCNPEVGNLSSQISIHFDQSAVNFTLTNHADPTCTNPSRVLTIPSSFELSEPSKVDGVDLFPIDYIIGKAALKFTKTQSRMNRTCNTGSQWVADQSQEVAGLVCSGVRLPTDNQMAYDVLAITDNKLRFGWSLKVAPENPGEIIDAISNNQPELRPKALAETVFEKQ